MSLDANRARRPQGRSDGRRRLGREVVSGEAQARPSRNRRAVDRRRQTDGDGQPLGAAISISAGVARGLALKARGRLIGGPPTRLELASFTAQGAGRRLTLAAPGDLDLWKRWSRHQRISGSSSTPAACRSRAAPGRPWTFERARSACRSRRSIWSRPASACRASLTARRRSAERQTTRLATGACVCSA